MSNLRAGLIGLGQMGRHHARVLQSLRGVDLVGVLEPQPDFDVSVPLVSDIDALIGLDLDLAVIAVPTRLHEWAATHLAEAGVSFLVEKPVAASAEVGDRIAEVSNRAGVVACVGHIERFNPALQELRRRLEEHQLGEIFQVATRRQGPFPARVADIGVVLDLATHDIDLTAWVTQEPYAAITAHTASRSGRDSEDLVAAVGTLTSGVVVNHLVNWLSPMKERVVVVTGERGCFVADTLAADLTFYANGVEPIEWETIASFRGVVQGDVIRYAIAKPEPLAVELAAFRDAVLGLENKTVGIEEATSVVRVAEAMLTGDPLTRAAVRAQSKPSENADSRSWRE